jgi:hypothetical protein
MVNITHFEPPTKTSKSAQALCTVHLVVGSISPSPLSQSMIEAVAGSLFVRFGPAGKPAPATEAHRVGKGSQSAVNLYERRCVQRIEAGENLCREPAPTVCSRQLMEEGMEEIIRHLKFIRGVVCIIFGILIGTALGKIF